MFSNPVEKPVRRGPLRKKLGKKYFILKRHLFRMFSGNKYARVLSDINYSHILIKHWSFLLRPLKDVDMQLQYNKITNLKLAVAGIDGVVIHPGETFSLWKLTGKPSGKKGYLEGLILDNGKITKGIGGGLCQLGNLLYWMVLHTDLEITERWRHSYDVFPDVNRTIPFGCGATLSYNYVDLQFKNNTDHSFKIALWLDDEYLNGMITAEKDPEGTYEIIEREHCFKHQWWGGYTRHNQIWKYRTNKISGERTEHLVCENHAVMMYNPMLSQTTSSV